MRHRRKDGGSPFLLPGKGVFVVACLLSPANIDSICGSLDPSTLGRTRCLTRGRNLLTIWFELVAWVPV
ncbi:Hypp143 [Branchiostoma lanceolatum]|uniref:Hypp143 protein n=1 Tax=Branchiostoma lanceolatum TaxID=7740 RepID=A0A8J9VXA0_BRALA|nr:Hypp143 [Branchiostoma lanceolatum]